MESAPILDQVRIEGNVLAAHTSPLKPLQRSTAGLFVVVVIVTLALTRWFLNESAPAAYRFGAGLLAVFLASLITAWLGAMLSRYVLNVDFARRTVDIEERRMFDRTLRFSGSLDEIARFEYRPPEIGLVWQDPDTPVLIMRPFSPFDQWEVLNQAAAQSGVVLTEPGRRTPFHHTAFPFAVLLSRDSVSLADDVHPGHCSVYRSPKNSKLSEVIHWARRSGYLPRGPWVVWTTGHAATIDERGSVMIHGNAGESLENGQHIHFRRTQ